MKFPTLRGLGRSSANATDVHSAAVRRALGLGSAASPSAINTADDTGSLSPITLTSPMPSITPEYMGDLWRLARIIAAVAWVVFAGRSNLFPNSVFIGEYQMPA